MSALDGGAGPMDPGDGTERAERQLRELADVLHEHLGQSLAGVYLHGSLAMDCFNPRRSDLDVLAVVKLVPPLSLRRDVLRAMMGVSLAPFPLEISILLDADLKVSKYPAPYLLHYSEAWRETLTGLLDEGNAEWQSAPAFGGSDPDLAAHITILNHRGRCLAGAPIEQVFPAVPVEDYRRSILLDLEWGARRAHEDPVYLVLNCCRVLAFLSEGKVFSKLEGGTWGMRSLPDDFVLLLEAALGSYQGTADHPVDQSLLASFLDHVKGKCPS